MLLEAIRDNPSFRRFLIGDLMFAQYTCPVREQALSVWTHTDHLVHVVSGRKTWRIAARDWIAERGNTLFIRKGALLLEQDFAEDFCAFVFFLPDDFVRDGLSALESEMPSVASASSDDREPAFRVSRNAILDAFLESMAVYFASDSDPPASLLRIKARELIASIVLGGSNGPLQAYLLSVAARTRPSLSTIMESSYCNNLPLEAFAQMCHRSLSSFKRDFRQEYGTSPGRWLLARRLDRAATVLRGTEKSVTEVAFECGFEDLSHFCRAFKRRFGCAPTDCR